MKKKIVRQWKCKTPNWARIVQVVGGIATVVNAAIVDGSLPFHFPKWAAVLISLAAMILPQFTGTPQSDNYNDLKNGTT